MIQILLVDDQPLVGEGTKLILEKEENMQVQVVTSCKSALELVKAHSYDVMLFNLQKSECDGFELANKVISDNPNAKILIFTGHDFVPSLELLMKSGAVGFISQTDTREQLIRMIQCAVNEEVILPYKWLQEIYQGAQTTRSLVNKGEEILLNEREKKILQELVKGKTNKVMAQDLFIGQRTLEYTLTAIFQKLGVNSRVEAVVRVKELGLIDS
jgi:two-component system, NarL family, competent response regulator ComA